MSHWSCKVFWIKLTDDLECKIELNGENETDEVIMRGLMSKDFNWLFLFFQNCEAEIKERN